MMPKSRFSINFLGNYVYRPLFASSQIWNEPLFTYQLIQFFVTDIVRIPR
jgi:hypothetical protein